MLCRHNRYVQDFGRVKGPGELSRRERTWSRLIGVIEAQQGQPAGSLPAGTFRELMHATLDVERFELRGV
jgi:hypothetical protein